MLRHSVLQTLKPTLLSPTTTRTLTTTIARMAEGDVGAPRSGGAAQGDAFSKREQADENLYVREKEKEKLRELKKKIAAHKEHLDELDKSVTEQMNASSGSGEKK